MFKNIMLMRCPRCHQGKQFVSANPYKKSFEMHKTCSHCELKYEKEPSFFYGAMYVSYSINIALFVISLIAYYVIFDEYISGAMYMSLYVLATFCLVPVLYRLSRSIWLHVFISHEPEKYG